MSQPTQRYARLMGEFWRHKRTAQLSPAAAGILTRAWSFAAENMTDGHVPRPLFAAFFNGAVDDKVIEELVASGCMKAAGGGYDLRDFLQWNISRDGWTKQKAAAKERTARSREKKRAGNAPVTRDNGDSHAEATAACASVTSPPLDEGRGTRDEDHHAARGGGSAPAAPAATPRVVESPTIAGLAEQVWAQRLGARGGSHVQRAGDGPHFRAVAEAADRARGPLPLRAQLERWFDEWVGTRKSPRLRAEWWAEWAVERVAQGAAAGGFFTPTPDVKHVATTPEELDAMFGKVTEDDLKRLDRGRGANG